MYVFGPSEGCLLSGAESLIGESMYTSWPSDDLHHQILGVATSSVSE